MSSFVRIAIWSAVTVVTISHSHPLLDALHNISIYHLKHCVDFGSASTNEESYLVQDIKTPSIDIDTAISSFICNGDVTDATERRISMYTEFATECSSLNHIMEKRSSCNVVLYTQYPMPMKNEPYTAILTVYQTIEKKQYLHVVEEDDTTNATGCAKHCARNSTLNCIMNEGRGHVLKCDAVFLAKYPNPSSVDAISMKNERCDEEYKCKAVRDAIGSIGPHEEQSVYINTDITKRYNADPWQSVLNVMTALCIHSALSQTSISGTLPIQLFALFTDVRSEQICTFIAKDGCTSSVTETTSEFCCEFYNQFFVIKNIEVAMFVIGCFVFVGSCIWLGVMNVANSYRIMFWGCSGCLLCMVMSIICLAFVIVGIMDQWNTMSEFEQQGCVYQSSEEVLQSLNTIFDTNITIAVLAAVGFVLWCVWFYALTKNMKDPSDCGIGSLYIGSCSVLTMYIVIMVSLFGYALPVWNKYVSTNQCYEYITTSPTTSPPTATPTPSPITAAPTLQSVAATTN